MQKINRNDNDSGIIKLLKLIMRIFRIKSRIVAMPIDTNKHWFAMIYSSSPIIILVVCLRLFFEFANTALPFVVGLLLTEQKPIYLIAIIAILFLTPVEGVILENTYSIWTAKLFHSFRTHMHKFFLYVDPIYHSTRSSGQIISKMNRLTGSLQTFLDIIVYNLFSVIFSLVSMVIIFITIDSVLTIMVTVSLLITILISFVTALKIRKPSQKHIILQEDRFKASVIENIQQNFFLRGIFAAQTQHTKAERESYETSVIQGAVWVLFSLSFQIVWIIQSIFTIGIIWYLYYMVIQQSLDGVIAITIVTTYLKLSQNYLFGIGRIVRIFDSYNEINDTWMFMKGFGSQTIPIDKTEKQMFSQ